MSSVPLLPPCIEGDKGAVNVGIGAVFLAICIVLTSLRIFARVRRVAAELGWDDAFVVIAMVNIVLNPCGDLDLTSIPGIGSSALHFHCLAHKVWSG